MQSVQTDSGTLHIKKLDKDETRRTICYGKLLNAVAAIRNRVCLFIYLFVYFVSSTIP